MKKLVKFLVMGAVVVAAGVLTGCQQEEKASAAPAADEKMDAKMHSAEHPSEQVPKDHPAH
ncbi:MAG: hypothetical protein AB7T27_10045 [Kiritimatiellia bacterium]